MPHPHDRDAGFSPLNRRIDFTACASGGEHWVGRRHGFWRCTALSPKGPRRLACRRLQAPVRQEWLLKRHEEIIEPELPIIDPHHHLWDSSELSLSVSGAACRRRQRPQYPRNLLRASSRDVSCQRAGRAQVAGRDRVRQRRRGNERSRANMGPTRLHRRNYRLCRSSARLRVPRGVLERHIAVSDGRLRAIRKRLDLVGRPRP